MVKFLLSVLDVIITKSQSYAWMDEFQGVYEIAAIGLQMSNNQNRNNSHTKYVTNPLVKTA